MQYSATTQEKLADELDAMPKGAVTPRIVGDYLKTRDACRATGL